VRSAVESGEVGVFGRIPEVSNWAQARGGEVEGGSGSGSWSWCRMRRGLEELDVCAVDLPSIRSPWELYEEGGGVISNTVYRCRFRWRSMHQHAAWDDVAERCGRTRLPSTVRCRGGLHMKAWRKSDQRARGVCFFLSRRDGANC
jgi:hypothetical protein